MVISRFPASDHIYLLKKILEDSSEGIVISDKDNKVVLVNKAFTDIMGYQPEEVIGQSGKFFRSSQHDEKFYKDLWDDVKTIGHWEGEMWVRRKSGESFLEWLVFSSIKNETGEVKYYLSIFSDITERKTTAERIHFLTFFDPLTQLPNRTSLNEHLAVELEHARRSRVNVSLLILNLDKFQNINNSLGPGFGDTILKEVAARLKKTLPEAAMIGRLSGSEFAIIFSNVHSPRDPAELAGRIISSVSKLFTVQSSTLSMSLNIGISVYPNDGEKPDDLFKNAGVAMNKAKEIGANTYQFFTPDMNEIVLERLKLENELREAIEAQALELYYQPQVNVNTGKIVGVEALLRWQPAGQTPISPGKFIPIAEQSGLIIPLTDWALKKACQQHIQWQKEGLNHSLIMSVNVTSVQFKQVDFKEKILNILQETLLHPRYLKLEITEGLLLQNIDQAIMVMTALKEQGIHFAIDDFGTGYSSLSYLLRLPIDQLKIDQSFVRGLLTQSESGEIIKAIISVAKSLKLSVIAEGVEEKTQLDFLKAQGCDEIQGFYFGKPMKASDISEMLRKAA